MSGSECSSARTLHLPRKSPGSYVEGEALEVVEPLHPFLSVLRRSGDGDIA